MMSTQKFIFESFEEKEEENINEPQNENNNSINEKDLNESYKKGFEEGYEKSIIDQNIDFLKNSEARIEEILKKISCNIDSILVNQEKFIEKFNNEVLKLTQAIFKQLFPITIKSFGFEEIMGNIRHTLTNIIQKRPITIQVSQAYLGEVIEQLDELKNFYPESIKIVASPNMSFLDVAIEFDGGGFFFDQSRVLENIESLLTSEGKI